MFGTKKGNAEKFIRNRLLHPSSREEKDSDFDHIQLCSPDQFKLDTCSEDEQYIVCSMNRDETAHALSFNIIKSMMFTSLTRISVTLMFIHLLVNKSTKIFGVLETEQAQSWTT